MRVLRTAKKTLYQTPTIRRVLLYCWMRWNMLTHTAIITSCNFFYENMVSLKRNPVNGVVNDVAMVCTQTSIRINKNTFNDSCTYVVHNEEKCIQYTYTLILVLPRLRMKYLHITFVEMSNTD